jgi:tRNA(Ile2) C34 agmatinyltransferase TiaS
VINTSLIEKLTELANKEKKVKEFRNRTKIKGKIVEKGTTKKGNMTLTIQRGEHKLKFTVLKSHKERFSLAERLTIGRSVSAIGISKLRMIICVSLKQLEKGIDDGRQTTLQ